MQMLKRAIGGVLLGVSLIAVPSERAEAQPKDFFTTWIFTGNCIDCADAADRNEFPVSGTLITRNYSAGDLTFANFVSFTYNGSNLLDPWELEANEFVEVGGNLFADPQSFSLFWSYDVSSGYFFMPSMLLLATSQVAHGAIEQVPGSWSMCFSSDATCAPSDPDPMPQDFGSQGAFTMQTSTVPEPSTYALMGLGLAVVGLASRRRRSN